MREIENKGLFWLWGIKMYKLRWVVAIFWILLFVFSAFFAQKLPDRLKDSGLTPQGSESDIGISLMKKEFEVSPSALTIVYKSNHLDLTSDQAKKDILQSLDKLNKKDYVGKIEINNTPRKKKDKGIQSVVVPLKLKNREALIHFSEIKRLISHPKGMHTYIDGEIATLHEIQQATKHDMAHSEKIGLPIALFVLLFIFGTVWAAILPLLIGTISVSLTMGITYFLTGYYSLSNFLPNIVMMLGMAIGVDYALFLVSRFREELKSQKSVEEAVGMAIQTAGKSVFFSGITVLIGMCGMLFIKLPIIYSLCLGGVLVVFSAMILSCTLLPALLGILGYHINSLKVFPGTQKKLENSIMWERLANFVMKRPAILAFLIITFLLSLMTPIVHMKVGVPTAEVLPPPYESRKGAELLKANYDIRRSSPINIVVKAKENVTRVASIREIKKYEDKIRQLPDVLEVQSYIDILGNRSAEDTSHLLALKGTHDRMVNRNLLRGNYALVTIVPQSKPDSTESSKLVHLVRNISMSD